LSHGVVRPWWCKAAVRRFGVGTPQEQAEADVEGYYILYTDYFADDLLHGKVVFRVCIWCALGSIHYCLISCSYLVQRSHVEGHECICNHAQHDHRELAGASGTWHWTVSPPGSSCDCWLPDARRICCLPYHVPRNLRYKYS
jgi:hypothetical protein